MNLGATVTILKQSSNPANGNVPILHVPKKARQVKSNVKTMLICFIDSRGVVHSEFEDIKKKMTEALKGITNDEFKKCFAQWKQRSDKCIESNGEYFEGD
jgi:hypothetical protein